RVTSQQSDASGRRRVCWICVSSKNQFNKQDTESLSKTSVRRVPRSEGEDD
ncbi:hypothetical protein JOQ06_020446, partial [Pogonophryne albipinna]